MGCWDEGVLSGAEPLDMLACLEKVLGIRELYPFENWDEEKRKEVKDAIECRWGKFLIEIARLRATGSDPAIGAQVAAVLVMAAGAMMPRALRCESLIAALNDSWARGSQTRKARMEELFQAVEKYDEEPILLTGKGLLEAAG